MTDTPPAPPTDPQAERDRTALSEQFDVWYRQGVDDAVVVNETNEPRLLRDDDMLAERWRSRGFQWMSANLDRQRLMRSRDDLAGQVTRLTERLNTVSERFELACELAASVERHWEQRAEAAEAQVATLTARVQTLRNALVVVEWAALAEDMSRCCPDCWAPRSVCVHEPDCGLAAALGDATP